ncbi:MAG: hypothetical protein ABI461_14330 [Polyangiaceae bacterium]
MAQAHSDSSAIAARAERVRLAAKIDAALGPFPGAHLAALIEVPRERFVRETDVARASEDVPLLLDDHGNATISAPHAYLLSFRILNLRDGDSLVELGSGSGYGAALASRIVGKTGRVDTFEVDEDLAERAEKLLAPEANVKVRWVDAHGSESFWGGALRVVVTFAIAEIPRAWIDALGDGGIFVAPVGRTETQRLVSITKNSGGFNTHDHGGVRYVRDRSRAG